MNMINYWFPLFFLTLMLLGVYQISRKRNEAAGILKPRLKRWKRGAVFYKLKPFVCAAFFVAVAAGVCLLLVGVKNIFSAIFLVIFCALLLLILVDILSTAYRYVYAEHAIQLFYGPLVYKKLNYDCLDGIIIANAASNNKIRRNQPYTPEDDHILSYKCKSSTGTTEVIYPYIVLYKTEGRRATLALLKAGMSSRAVAYDAGKGCVCLGICWFDSFAELLQHTTIPAYLLEDVYLRFRGMFDAILAKHGHECDRFYIVTNRAIPYQTYLNQHSGTP